MTDSLYVHGFSCTYVSHKKLTLSNQQMLQMNVVTYDLVMKKITLGSPSSHGASVVLNQKLVKQKKNVTNKSCRVCFRDEKNHHHSPTGWPQAFCKCFNSFLIAHSHNFWSHLSFTRSLLKNLGWQLFFLLHFWSFRTRAKD